MSTISASTTSTTAYKVTADTTGTLVLQTGASPTTAMTIDGSQNVGIGTSSPTGKVTVSGGGSYAPSLSGQMLTLRSGSSWSYLTMGNGDSANSYRYIAAASATQAFGTVTDAGAVTEQVRIDSSGNVGIGTSSPSVNLEVTGGSAPNIKVSSTSNVYTYLTMNAWALDRAQLRAEGASGGGSGSGGGVLSLWTANSSGTMTERARIDSSGNLLVGKTSASASTAGFWVVPDGTIYSTLSASTAGTNTNLVYSTGASAYRFYVGMEGKVYCTSTTITGISDQRLKENIRDLDDGLEKVMALQPRKFDWKEGKGKGIANDRGFIAQEFAQVFPDMIDEWLDPAPEGEEPYKAVNANLVPTLVKAIQELKAELDAVKAQLQGAA